MIPKECKRLAEVDFPIATVSRHAVREKSIRKGHPSTLHLWWARRPLASSRAVLLGLLLPDPTDPACPESFRKAASATLQALAKYFTTSKTGKDDLVADLIKDLNGSNADKKKRAELRAQTRQKFWSGYRDVQIWPPEVLQHALMSFIAWGAAWEQSARRSFLDNARALVRAAHGREPPLVVDPFAGGGSIPLEAVRLGCEAFASDLNPVACLILKVMLEDIPRQGPELADELRRAGAEINGKAQEELADLYPTDPDGATPIAYLWARTVRCEAPDCGAEIPLMRSFWLSKKPKRKRALRVLGPYLGAQTSSLPLSDRGKMPSLPGVEFEVFEPEVDRKVRRGTVTRAKATCLCCSSVLPPDRVRAQLSAQRGGADVIFDTTGQRAGGARMIAVVTLRPGEKGRHYRLPMDADYQAVCRSQARLADMLGNWERDGKLGLCPVPDEPTPVGGGSGAGRAFSVQRYGMLKWGDLFTARQKVALVGLLDVVRANGSFKVTSVLACALDRVAMSDMSCTRWNAVAEKMQHTFGRQALPMVWDFAEVVVTAEAPGNWKSGYRLIADVIDKARSVGSAQIQLCDATNHLLPDQSAAVWFTDPPYYDAIPYSDLSDFFLVWLKRTVPDHPLLRDPFDPHNRLSPKTREAVQDETKENNGRPKDRKWFEETMAKAFAEGRRILDVDGIGSVVFAHKTTEGWEALLSGMIRGGWTITGSWPIATEMASRLRARDSAALATSIHLICRPRPENAPVGDWADVLRELPLRVTDWMERLQKEGIRGADLVFACIGPALEIFSRYRAVETAEGHTVGLHVYLEKVWEVVGRAALQQVLGPAEAEARNGLAGTLEEDARLTALFLWTLQSTDTVEENAGKTPTDEATEEAVVKAAAKGFTLPFDVVRRFAQPMGIDLDAWTSRIIDQKKGMVRLLPVAERAGDLFGTEGAGAAAEWIENDPNAVRQLTLFPERDAGLKIRNRHRKKMTLVDGDAEIQTIDATVLDRVHAAMLLQANGHANALRALIDAEQDRGPDFLRLANALSALYPRGSEEKRLLDAMLLTVRT